MVDFYIGHQCSNVFDHNLSVTTVLRNFAIVPRAQYYSTICALKKRTAMCKYYRRRGVAYWHTNMTLPTIRFTISMPMSINHHFHHSLSASEKENYEKSDPKSRNLKMRLAKHRNRKQMFNLLINTTRTILKTSHTIQGNQFNIKTLASPLVNFLRISKRHWRNIHRLLFDV